MAGSGARKKLKEFGSKLGAGEYNKLVNEFGAEAAQRAYNYAKSSPNIGISSSAKTAYQSSFSPAAPAVTPAASQIPYIDTAGGYGIAAGRYSQPEYEFISAYTLTQLNGDIERELEQIRGVNASNVANIQGGYSVDVAKISAGASKYMADRDAEARKYIADQDLLKGTRVAEIEGKNRIDLQAIINTGLESIENIRGTTEREVAELQGEYGIKQESQRQRGQKEIAKLGAETSFRNALISAFGF